MGPLGVSVSTEALNTFNAFRRRGESDIAFVTYKINGKILEVDEVVKQDQLKEILSSEETMSSFKQLPNEEDGWACMRYFLTRDKSAKFATVVCKYKNKSAEPREELTLVTWLNDDAPVKERLSISVAEEDVCKAFAGLNFRLEAKKDSDLDYFEAAKNASKGSAVF